MVVNITSGTGCFPQAWHLCTRHEKGKPVSPIVICRSEQTLFSWTVADFEEVTKKIHTLSNSFVGVNFPRFGSILSSLLSQYSEFENGINKDLQITLPLIRGNQAGQQELIGLLERYSDSVYHKSNIQLFLNCRTKEIDSIYNILDIVHGTTIVVDDGRSGTGNKCLQVRWSFW